MKQQLTEKDFTFVSIHLVTELPRICRTVEIFHNYWWATKDGTHIAFFRGQSPQCNKSEAVARKLSTNKVYNSVLMLIPVVFMPFSIKDVYSRGEYVGWDRNYNFPVEKR